MTTTTTTNSTQQPIITSTFPNHDTFTAPSPLSQDGLPTNHTTGATGTYHFANTQEDMQSNAWDVSGVVTGMGCVSRTNEEDDDVVFRGALVKDELSTGTYEYGNSSKTVAKRYKGTFQSSFPSGLGQIEFKNGDFYDGGVVEGRVNGTGVYTYANGDVVAGMYVDGHITQGVKKANGAKYVGEFSTTSSGAVFHGFGHVEYANGDWYEGQWKNGAYCGAGTYGFADRTQITAKEWKHDRPYGQGEIRFADGTRFMGSFNAIAGSFFSGTGSIKFSDGSLFESLNLNDGGFIYPSSARTLQTWIEMPMNYYNTGGNNYTTTTTMLGRRAKRFGVLDHDVRTSAISQELQQNNYVTIGIEPDDKGAFAQSVSLLVHSRHHNSGDFLGIFARVRGQQTPSDPTIHFGADESMAACIWMSSGKWDVSCKTRGLGNEENKRTINFSSSDLRTKIGTQILGPLFITPPYFLVLVIHLPSSQKRVWSKADVDWFAGEMAALTQRHDQCRFVVWFDEDNDEDVSEVVKFVRDMCS